MVFFATIKNSPKSTAYFLATKLHEGTRRKKEYLNLPNEKFLEVRKPGFWPPEAKVIVDGGFWIFTMVDKEEKITYHINEVNKE